MIFLLNKQGEFKNVWCQGAENQQIASLSPLEKKELLVAYGRPRYLISPIGPLEIADTRPSFHEHHMTVSSETLIVFISYLCKSKDFLQNNYDKFMYDI